MIVIGADTHKRTHALAAVEEGTGRQRGTREIKSEEAGHLAALRAGHANSMTSECGNRGLSARLAPV